MATSTEFLNKAVQKKQGSLAFAWLADREFEAGNSSSAAEILDEGLSLYPDFIPGSLVKAKLLKHLNKPAEAISILQFVLEHDPLHLSAQKSLLQLLIEQKRGSEAQHLLSRLRELDSLAPEFPVIPEALLAEAAPLAAVAPAKASDDFFIERDQLFASLEDAFLEETVVGDEKSASELQSELEAALAAAPSTEAKDEYFPTDEESGSKDVSSLFSQMFGGEETKAELPVKPEPQAAVTAPIAEPPPIEEIQSEPALGSFFSSFSKPEPKAEVPAIVPEPQEPQASAVFEKSSMEQESKPVGGSGIDLASALDELFGEDDALPIEGMEPKGPAEPLQQAAPAPKTDDGLSTGLADALGDLFGEEDDLPVEGQEPRGPVAMEAEEGNLGGELFEKSAEAESKLEEGKPDEGLTGGVADALGDLFGEEDDLPVEGQEPRGPVAMEAEEGNLGGELFEKSAEAESKLEEGKPDESLTGGVANALGDLFGEEDDLPVEGQEPRGPVAMEAEEGNLGIGQLEQSTELETKSEEAKSYDDELTSGVANALGDLFGEEEDSSTETSRGATTMDELLGGSPVSSSEIEAEPKIELQSLADSIYDTKPEVKPEPSSGDDFKSGVAEALGGLFGNLDDDDLPLSSDMGAQAQQESPFADLLAGEEEAHDEGAVLSGDLAESLIKDPIAPVSETQSAPVNTPPQSPNEDESFSGGMSNALSDLFGAELEEDLSDLMTDKPDAAAPQGTTFTLGELYLEQGHVSEALQVFQELLVSDPSNEDLRQKISEIQQRIQSGEGLNGQA